MLHAAMPASSAQPDVLVVSSFKGNYTPVPESVADTPIGVMRLYGRAPVVSLTLNHRPP